MPSQVDAAVTATTRRWMKRTLFTAITLLIGLSSIVEVSRVVFKHGNLLGLVHMFVLSDEANLPTWYASATLLIAGFVAGTIAFLHYQEGNSIGRQWALFAGLLTLMSLDETASVHEMPSVMAYFLVRAQPGNIPWYVIYAWVVPGALVLAGVVWWFASLWKALPTVIRRQFTIATAVFFGGALGLEAGEAAWAARFTPDSITLAPPDNLGFSLIWTLQETCEMVGVALLILALFDYLVLTWTSVNLRLHGDARG